MSTLELLDLLGKVARYVTVEWGKEPVLFPRNTEVLDALGVDWGDYILYIDTNPMWFLLSAFYEQGDKHRIYAGSDPDAMLEALFELRADDA